MSEIPGQSGHALPSPSTAGLCQQAITGEKERPPRLCGGRRPFLAVSQAGAPHILTISVRYFGSRAAISFPFSAISSGVGFGGGDVRPSTGNRPPERIHPVLPAYTCRACEPSCRTGS